MSAGNDFVHTVFILYHCIYTSFWGYFLTGIIEYIFFSLWVSNLFNMNEVG